MPSHEKLTVGSVLPYQVTVEPLVDEDFGVVHSTELKKTIGEKTEE